MTAQLKPMTVSSFALGMNTRRPDFDLKLTTPPYGRFMREIVNCDLAQAGNALKLRRGYTKVLSAAAGNALWADDTQAYYANGTALVALADVANTLTATAVTGAALSSGAPVSFSTAPFGGAFWTDGVSLGYVLAGVSVPVAPPQPIVLPAVTTGAGTLDAGIYSVAYTYVDAAGRQSAATAPLTVTLAAGSSLVFTLSTAPAYKLRVFVSLPNGVEVYSALDFNAGATGAQTLTVLGGVLSACITMGLQNMPAGRFVRYNNGRLLVAVGNILFFSKPYMSGLYDPTMDFIQFPTPIEIVECVTGEGTYVVADQTYWFDGDIADTKPITISPDTAIPGTGVIRPETGDVAWMSTRGLVLGGSAGKVELPQDDNITVGLTTLGASGFIERDGRKQIVVTLLGTALAIQSESSQYTSGELVDSATPFDTWVVNIESGASMRYANYAFNGFAQIAGRYYGSKADGVYLLEGSTDAGALINASINPGRQDFGSPMRMRMEAAYMTVGSTGPMHLTITNDKAEAYTYDTRRNDPELKQQRLDLGRGLNGNYLSFRVTTDLGCAFELAKIELIAVETTRRIAG